VLESVRIDDIIFRHRTGSITVPEDLIPAIEAVLGLDNRPIARPHCVRLRTDYSAPQAAAHSPLEMAELYEFPSHLDGSGQTIGIIELDGGFIPSDVETYFRKLGLTPPKIETVLIDGQTNSISRHLPLHPELNADDEVAADIEIAGAIAPGARQVVYFAQNTDQSFLKAVNAAIFATPRPACISISWGQAENACSKQAMRAFEAAFQDAANLGIPVCVSAGNAGWVQTSFRHVDFPASAPHALSCGGTRLIASDGAITGETVWSAADTSEDKKIRRGTVAGQSQFFTKPLYQSKVVVLAPAEGSTGGRVVPDVAGNADPETGYRVRVKGVEEIVGGTGVVAPLWAALIARMAQAMGGPVGFLHPQIYKPRTRAEGFHHIPENSNDNRGEDRFSHEDRDWNPCIGLGTPKASALLRALGVPLPPQPRPEARIAVHPIKPRIPERAHRPESSAHPVPLSPALVEKRATALEPAAERRIQRPPVASLQPPTGPLATPAERPPVPLIEHIRPDRPEILGPRTSDAPRLDSLISQTPFPKEYRSATQPYLPCISNHVDPVALVGILGLTALTGMAATVATVSCIALGNGRSS
jgi:kumamolisin